MLSGMVQVGPIWAIGSHGANSMAMIPANYISNKVGTRIARGQKTNLLKVQSLIGLTPGDQPMCVARLGVQDVCPSFARAWLLTQREPCPIGPASVAAKPVPRPATLPPIGGAGASKADRQPLE